VPDPTAETEAVADINRALKRKLSEAVRVANVCYRALEREKGCNRAMEEEMDEVDEIVRKLKWALLIQREAYQRIRCNPCGVPQGPTPAEVQERMAEEKKQREKEEHRRQAQFEHDKRRKLAEKMERERQIERRDQEAEAQRISRMKMDARLKKSPEENLALWAAATAIAATQGRDHPKLADFQQCHKLGLLWRKGLGQSQYPSLSTTMPRTSSTGSPSCP
jgi:hypothetical protein